LKIVISFSFNKKSFFLRRKKSEKLSEKYENVDKKTLNSIKINREKKNLK